MSAPPSIPRRLFMLGKRHWDAVRCVLTVILPSILRNRARPVLFSKYSGIGDIICTFPAALELRKRHPKSEAIYNCHPDFACLPAMGGVAAQVTGLAEAGVIGFWYRHLLAGYYHFVSDDDRPEIVPTEVYIKDFARHFNVTVSGEHPVLRVSPEVRERVLRLLQQHGLDQGSTIAFHAGPSWPVREWPRNQWNLLVRELRRLGHSGIVQIGSSHLLMGSPDTEGIQESLSLVGQLSLEESVALIALSRLFVGIDSGMLHVAAALRVPSVGLWGPTSPALRFSPATPATFLIADVPCQGCHHRSPRLHWVIGCPFDIVCMKSIGPEDVLEACVAELRRPQPSAPENYRWPSQ